ncbi:MAG: amidohydrolase family protein, partial [Gaiellaceae bacterium]
QEGYGYTDLNDETKAKIFGGNMARLHNLDVDAIKSAISDDEWARRRKAYTAEPSGPWRELRERVGAGVAA